MEDYSYPWLQDRINQLRASDSTTTPKAVISSLEALLGMFHCQLSKKDDFHYLAHLSRSLIGTEAQVSMIQVLKEDPDCAALIEERYLPSYYDLHVLLKFPTDSLGYAYANKLMNTELYSDLYSDIFVNDEVSYVEARLGQTHDIWHFLTGFDTSIEGEIGLQAFYLAQFPYPLASMLIANTLVRYTLIESQNLPILLAEIEKGWKLGKQAKPLFPKKWEKAWDRPIADLRQELNIN